MSTHVISIVSGYFNPIHKGHLEYFQKAKEHADELYVIVNSDYQRELKGSSTFQDEEERLAIVKSMRLVDNAMISIDNDRTVINTIRMIHAKNNNTDITLCFANGGDQNNSSIPEAKICKELGIVLIDGLGDKIQSSSWLIEPTDD